MIYVGIDVAKNKHDCCILAQDGQTILDYFSFPNNLDGFLLLKAAIYKAALSDPSHSVKAGLEATGHYSTNIENFLLDCHFDTVVFNPLQVNLFRKSLSLRKTKTDKVDACFIAKLLLTSTSSPVATSYQIQELKALTRHRSRLIHQRSLLKLSLDRLIVVLFPELPSVCNSLSQASIRALLLQFPSAKLIANCRIDRLTNLLKASSKGRYSRAKALEIRSLAQRSIGFNSPAYALELQFTLQQINFLQKQIDAIDDTIKAQLALLHSPITSIPGISHTLAAIIIAEIGDIHRFSSPDKLQAFAGLEPSTYQSGKFIADKTTMVKHGSTYLRWALIQAARLVSIYCDSFAAYLAAKLAQGKHYFVALGHTAKKLIRLIFHMLSFNELFVPQA